MYRRILLAVVLLLIVNSQVVLAQEGRGRGQRRKRAAVTHRGVAVLPVYKRGAIGNQRNFVLSDSQWPQPNGKGSAVTITYSYSNLLNGQMSGLSH